MLAAQPPPARARPHDRDRPEVPLLLAGRAAGDRLLHARPQPTRILEATEGERVRLQPANATMEPIYVHRSEFRAVDIVGKVVGVYRRMH